MTNGTVSLEDWEPVDLDECDEFESKDLEEIQDKLIELMKVAGLYFQNA